MITLSVAVFLGLFVIAVVLERIRLSIKTTPFWVVQHLQDIKDSLFASSLTLGKICAGILDLVEVLKVRENNVILSEETAARLRQMAKRSFAVLEGDEGPGYVKGLKDGETLTAQYVLDE